MSITFQCIKCGNWAGKAEKLYCDGCLKQSREDRLIAVLHSLKTDLQYDGSLLNQKIVYVLELIIEHMGIK